MIYIDTPLVEWCKKYDLPTDPTPCGACGELMKSRPFRIKGYAGLEHQCTCGKPYSGGSTAVPCTEDTKDFWGSVMGAIVDGRID